MSSFSQINTNIQSQQAFQNLSETSEELSTRRERLSTGLRINSAEDDAAGFEIANQLEAKTRGQDQALRNIGDAKSALSTAEGALDSQLEILQTAKEKATQASNGSLSQSERESIGGELDQLAKEIQDIAGNAKFNGQNLIKGGSDGPSNDQNNFSFQTGAGEDTQFDVGIQNSAATDIQGDKIDGTTVSVGKDTSELSDGTNLQNVTFNDEGVAGFSLTDDGGNVTLQGNGTAISNGTSDVLTDDAAAASGNSLDKLEGGEFDLKITETTDGAGEQAFDVSVNGDSGTTQRLEVDPAGTPNVISDDGGATSTGDINGDTVELENADGDTLSLNFNGANADKLSDAISNNGGSVETSVKVGGDGVEFGVDVADKTGEAAEDAISVLDDSIDQVAGELSDLGAAQNRLSFKESNLETSRTNLNAAQSRIEDADFAKEQTQVAKLQVQQQSGTAQLAQANAAGQSVLSLLQ